jgi:negative regulator of flagellin synthesis FlgM
VKIDNSIKSVSGAPIKDAQGRQGRTEGTKSTGASTEQVQISTLSSQLQQLQSRLANSPVVDIARVEEIKQAMSEGKFKVDTGKVADGLLQAAQNLIASGSPPAPGAAK